MPKPTQALIKFYRSRAVPAPDYYATDCRGCWRTIKPGELAVELPSGQPAHADCLERITDERYWTR